ncbi:MAG: phosphotransferase [Chloroflexi bacterium]|nr:phosphotransferase [Chloroflexota bacterium]
MHSPEIATAPSSESVRALLERVAPGATEFRVREMAGSFSNYTHLVEARLPDGELSRLVVRRYKLHSQPDVGAPAVKARTEFEALGMLQRHCVPAPRPLLLDERGDILGSPGIVTSFVEGRHVAVPRAPKTWARRMAQTLARIHSITPTPQERKFLLDGNYEAVWFLRRGEVLERMAARPDGEVVWHTVRDLLPSLRKVPDSLVHIDFWTGNVLWVKDRISAVVDWEEAAYGDPAYDVAYCRFDMFTMGQQPAAGEFLRVYEAEMGRRVENLAFWELAAAVRAMPDPGKGVRELRALGVKTCTATSLRHNLRRFVASALRRLA